MAFRTVTRIHDLEVSVNVVSEKIHLSIWLPDDCEYNYGGQWLTLQEFTDMIKAVHDAFKAGQS